MKTRPRFLLPVFLIVTATAAQSAIITSTFTGNTSQSYNTGTNWSPTGVPANGANQFQVVIPPAVALPVLFDLDATINTLNLGVGSTLSIQNTRTLTAADDFTNNGLILLSGSSSPTGFGVGDPVNQSITLGGGGILRLTDPAQAIGGSTAHVLTQGPLHTIEGTGNIGNIALNLVNQGTIRANVSGQALTFSPWTTFLNGGLVRAENGGIVAINRGIVTQGPGGSFQVADGSRFDFQGITLAGVSLTVDDQDSDISNNLYSLGSSGAIFKEVNLTGTLSINANALSLAGDLTNNGIIRTLGNTPDSSISISDPDDGQVLLGGTGRVIMNDPAQTIKGSTAHILTQGPLHTIEGTGNIGYGAINVVNQGTILANAATPLIFQQRTSFENQGTLRVESGSTISVITQGLTNKGLIDVKPGGSFLSGGGVNFVQSAGELRVNGLFQSAGLLVNGGIVSGAGTIQGSSVSIAGTVKPGNPVGTLNLGGGATIYGPVEIELQSDSVHDRIDFNNIGYGTITLALKKTGPASGFSGAPIEFLSHIQLVGLPFHISISNVAPGGRLVTTDGRASFIVNGSDSSNEFTLTSPLFAPEFTAEPYAYSVGESAAIGTTVGTINAIDPEGSGVTYSIIGSTPFAIGAATGIITVNGPLDFSSQPVHVVQVGASDGNLTAITPVTIKVNPLPGSNEAVVHGLLTGPGGPFPGQTNPAVVGFNADPDGDAISNVFELWLGSNPAVAGGPANLVVFPLTVGPNAFAALDVTVVKSVDNVIDAKGQLTLDLGTFRNGARSQLSETATTRRLRFLDSVSIPGAKAFGRLATDPDAVK